MKIGPLFQIGGSAPKGPVGKIHATLEKVALRATELGRTEIAVAAVNGLQKLSGGDVSHVTVSDSTFTG